MGLTALLSRASLREKDRHCLEVAAREVAHLEKILRDLLNFARPQELQLAEENVNRILDETLDELTEDFRQAGVSVGREVAPDLPDIPLDAKRIRQVFLNVLINAKEALTKGGTISVRTQSVPDRSTVRVEISDSGKGIRKDVLERVFQPFFSTREGGTGLGLPVVRKFVEAHGGTVGIESRWRKGTTVWVELPSGRPKGG